MNSEGSAYHPRDGNHSPWCASPGPSAYNVSGSLLKKASSPLTLKGGPRFVDPAAKVAAGLPGPGQYSVPISVGRQPVSTKPTKPVVGFPKAQRDASKKVHPQSSTH